MINLIDINHLTIKRQIKIYYALHNKSPTISISHKTYEILEIWFKANGINYINYINNNTLCGSKILFDENLPFGMINFE